jgi:MFS family permease
MQVFAQLAATILYPDTATVFNYPHGSTQGLLNCIQTVGGLVSKFESLVSTRFTLITALGLILGPYMADYGGRKWTIFVGCTIVVIAGLVQCFSVNIHMFTAARFLSTLNSLLHGYNNTNMGLVGMGSGFSGLGSPLLITELAHPAERGKITALYKYVTLSILTQSYCVNTAKARNTTLALFSEAVSNVSNYGSFL